ncbi:hypothetical protein SSU98_0673 [Streptococcus suis 98HAH33]|nr:hypothetical protein SSU05_0674 [Streptococcus suis 05ZYH33]ABP91830.1 hypothetical protein SSU98_0673 [Streptococcus suis 98HAH33]
MRGFNLIGIYLSLATGNLGHLLKSTFGAERGKYEPDQSDRLKEKYPEVHTQNI